MLVAAVLMLSGAFPAAAQGIYKTNVNTENSIVRVWQDRDVVIYNEESPGKGAFLLYTVGATSAQHINLPIDISVKDFEIMDDEIWFCGDSTGTTLPGGKCGVVGTFNIPNTFAGADIINYAVMGIWFSQPNYVLYISGLERLDLFQIGNYTVMAMTGDCYIHQSLVRKRSTVVSVILNGTQWNVSALRDVDSTAVYTDIAALDNVVTAVGTSVDGTGLIAKSFYKSISFPNSPTTPNYGDSIVCSSPIGKALITHLSDDEAAVVQLDEKGRTLLHMLEFSTGNAIPTAPTRVTDDPYYLYNSEWNLNEIRYSPLTDNISVLEYGILPGSNVFETLLWSFPRIAWHPTLVPVQPMSTVRQASMDVDIDNHPVTVGKLLGSGNLDVQSYAAYTGYYSPPMAPLLEWDDCVDYEEIEYLEEYPTVLRVFVNDNESSDSFNNREYQPQVSEIIFTQICGKE